MRGLIVRTYYRVQIYAVGNGYYDDRYSNDPFAISLAHDHFCSKLAEAGGITRLAYEFVGGTPPRTIDIRNDKNAPPHQSLTMIGGKTTLLIVYTDADSESRWKEYLESLGARPSTEVRNALELLDLEG